MSESETERKSEVPASPRDEPLFHCDKPNMAHLEFPREIGLILRCAGKAGNPFQTTQGNRLSCRDQDGRMGSEEAVPGPSVFPSGDPGVSGDFWGSQEGCQGPSRVFASMNTNSLMYGSV